MRAKRQFLIWPSAVSRTLSQEPQKLRDEYGRNQIGQGTLLARRLVEAGVPFVSVFSHIDVDKGSWDTHQQHVARVTK